MKNNKIIRMLRFSLLAAVLCGFSACSDWTQTETVVNTTIHPWEQGPDLWAQYLEKLRNYRKSEHFIVYARLENSPKVAVSEANYMRGLPDSLDIVTLTNADNFSAHDREDMPLMRDKGIKVLYQVDYAGRAGEFPDVAALGVYLDKVIATVQAEGLDGYSFTGIPQLGDAATEAAAALLVQKLASGEGKLLVFEGNPLFVAQADRVKIDYFALDTQKTLDVLDVRMQVLNALDYARVPAKKLLLAADAGATLRDEDRREFAAIDEMARRVISFGPLGGLATYQIGHDYYYSDLNYKTIRLALQTLNPSK